MDIFETSCEVVKTGATAIATGTVALQGLGKVIDGTTNYVLQFRDRDCYYCGEVIKGGRHMMRPHVENHRIHLVKCFICKEKFKPEELESHVTNHWLKCFICSKVFKIEDLEAHVLKHWFVDCSDCSEKIKVEDYISHMRTHQRQIPCPDCNKNIAVENLGDHLEMHRVGGCGFCYQKVSCKEMYEHTAKHRDDELRYREELMKELQFLRDFTPISNRTPVVNTPVVNTNTTQLATIGEIKPTVTKGGQKNKRKKH